MAPNFAAGSCDPRAAYAIGMVVKMLRAPPPPPIAASSASVSVKNGVDDAKRDAHAANVASISQVKLEKLQRVLESPHVEAREKQVLVTMIEDAESVQDVWILLDRVQGSDSTANDDNNSSNTVVASAVAAASPILERAGAPPAIPEELGCAICCSELMLKPVSLACGHSFCRYCLELWLGTRANCPTCRHAAPTECALGVNVALQQVIASFFPAQLQALEAQSQSERFDQLRRAIHDALVAGGGDDLRDVLARLPPRSGGSVSRQQRDLSLAVALVLESDVELQERVLAAEIHERLRKERLLRESSRRRHTAAYTTTGLNAQVDPAILHIGSSTTTVRRGSGSSSTSRSSSNLLTSFLGRKS